MKMYLIVVGDLTKEAHYWPCRNEEEALVCTFEITRRLREAGATKETMPRIKVEVLDVEWATMAPELDPEEKLVKN